MEFILYSDSVLCANIYALRVYVTVTLYVARHYSNQQPPSTHLPRPNRTATEEC